MIVAGNEVLLQTVEGGHFELIRYSSPAEKMKGAHQRSKFIAALNLDFLRY